jgi:Protein of unknown function (DUF4232)
VRRAFAVTVTATATAAVAALLAGVVVAGPVAGAATGSSSVYGSAAANRAGAQRAAATLVGELSAGPGAVRSATAPGGLLRQPGYLEVTPNEVDAHRWFTTAASPESVLAYVAAHLPRGTERSGGGSEAGSDGLRERNWPLPAVPGTSQRVVSVSTTPMAGGRTAVRLDGVAVWLTPRPPWERIPSGVESVTFSGHTNSLHTGKHDPVSEPVTVAGVRASRLAALVNRLEAAQPFTTDCPAGSGTVLHLTFHGAGGRTLATVAWRDEGCVFVGLRIGGRSGPGLADTTLGAHPQSVIGELLADHDVRDCSPPQLALSTTAPEAGNENDETLAFGIRDRSDELCFTGGAPHVTLAGAAGTPLPTHQTTQRDGVPIGSLLFPGQDASFDVSFDTCAKSPAATGLRIALTTGATFTTPPSIRRGPIRPCGGRLTVSGFS